MPIKSHYYYLGSYWRPLFDLSLHQGEGCKADLWISHSRGMSYLQHFTHNTTVTDFKHLINVSLSDAEDTVVQ